MKKKRRQIINTDVFSIYESLSNPSTCYAIYPDQVNQMNETCLNHLDKPIPDEYTIMVYKFGKVKEKDLETEIWDIIDKKPVECRINDLTSQSTGYKFCF